MREKSGRPNLPTFLQMVVEMLASLHQQIDQAFQIFWHALKTMGTRLQGVGACLALQVAQPFTIFIHVGCYYLSRHWAGLP